MYLNRVFIRATGEVQLYKEAWITAVLGNRNTHSSKGAFEKFKDDVEIEMNKSEPECLCIKWKYIMYDVVTL
jgi:hypothetical protein